MCLSITSLIALITIRSYWSGEGTNNETIYVVNIGGKQRPHWEQLHSDKTKFCRGIRINETSDKKDIS